jgi:hypothetical protein
MTTVSVAADAGAQRDLRGVVLEVPAEALQNSAPARGGTASGGSVERDVEARPER